MPHQIYYSSIEEHLFLIEQIAHASLPCIKELHASLNTKKDEEWITSDFDLAHMEYTDWLEKTISDYLIQCATRTRIIQDSMAGDFEQGHDPDKEAYDLFEDVAICHEGKIRLSLRECCNKVIHAKRFELDFVSEEQYPFSYWNGKCQLRGDNRGQPWHIEINLKRWVLAMKHYYECLKHS